MSFVHVAAFLLWFQFQTQSTSGQSTHSSSDSGLSSSHGIPPMKDLQKTSLIFIFSFITLVINQCCALSELRLNKHNPTQPMKTAAQNVFCVFLLHFSVCFTQKMSFSCNLMDNKVFLSRTFLKITCLTSHPLMNLLCSTVKTNRNFSNGDLKNNLSVWEVKLNKLASKHTSLVISVSHFLVKWSSYHYNCFKCE